MSPFFPRGPAHGGGTAGRTGKRPGTAHIGCAGDPGRSQCCDRYSPFGVSRPLWRGLFSARRWSRARLRKNVLLSARRKAEFRATTLAVLRLYMCLMCRNRAIWRDLRARESFVPARKSWTDQAATSILGSSSLGSLCVSDMSAPRASPYFWSRSRAFLYSNQASLGTPAASYACPRL